MARKSRIEYMGFTSFDEYEALINRQLEEGTDPDENCYVINEAGWTKSDGFVNARGPVSAVRRFFKACPVPYVSDWEEEIAGNVKGGLLNDTNIRYPEYRGTYSWGVEHIDEGRYYVFLNIKDEAFRPAISLNAIAYNA